jgi:NAD+ kinase
MVCLLVYNSKIPKTMAMANKIGEQLKLKGVIISCEDVNNDFLLYHKIDRIMVFGGDGTIIRVANQYAERGIPVLGINMGTVGFLSSLETDEIEEYLDKFIIGDYRIEERMLLEVSIYNSAEELQNKFISLNEVCIKSNAAHMIHLGIEIDGNLHSQYRGDGILVATPTGSTAYSLSAGGPVVDPELEVILITPLVSYFLSKKPMVIGGEKEVTLCGLKEDTAYISIDGQISYLLQSGYILKIHKADCRFKIINLKRRDFFASVDQRLGQNGSWDKYEL